MNLPSLRRRAALSTGMALLAFGATGAAAGPAWSASGPRVRIVTAPPARTSAPEAEFYFKTLSTRTSCRRDNLPYKPCRVHVKYVGVRPGKHVFRVRARHNGRTSYTTYRWKVTGSRGKFAPAQAAMDGSAPTTPAGTGPAGPRKMVFQEEFSGSEFSPAWWNVYHSPGNDGHGLRRASAFSLDGKGNLVVTAKMVDGTLVSGGMASLLEFRYGRVEFRVRTEPDPAGILSGVVLTWPEHQLSPEFTENDMYETGHEANNRRDFHSFIHFGRENWQFWIKHPFDPTAWRTIAMEWYPNLQEIYVDGKLALHITEPDVIPDVLHHMSIQLDPRRPGRLKRPVRMFVDYVRIYQ